MPQMIPFIIPLITAGAGITTGVMQSNAAGDSADKQRQSVLDAQRKAQQDSAAQRSQAFKQFAPDVQSATGGSLTDPSFANMVQMITGMPAGGGGSMAGGGGSGSLTDTFDFLNG